MYYVRYAHFYYDDNDEPPSSKYTCASPGRSLTFVYFLFGIPHVQTQNCKHCRCSWGRKSGSSSIPAQLRLIEPVNRIRAL